MRRSSENGMQMLEYVIMVLMMAMIILAGVAYVGERTEKMLDDAGTAMTTP